MGAPTWGSPAPGRAGWRPRRAPRSQLGSDVALPAGKTELSVCGDTTFAVETAAGVRAPPTYAGNYADGQASAKNVFYITGALAVSSWDGKEWPAPLQTTGDFIGAPVV